MSRKRRLRAGRLLVGVERYGFEEGMVCMGHRYKHGWSLEHPVKGGLFAAFRLDEVKGLPDRFVGVNG